MSRAQAIWEIEEGAREARLEEHKRVMESLHKEFGYRPDEEGGEQWVVYQDRVLVVIHPERRPRIYERRGGGTYYEIEPLPL